MATPRACSWYAHPDRSGQHAEPNRRNQLHCFPVDTCFDRLTGVNYELGGRPFGPSWKSVGSTGELQGGERCQLVGVIDADAHHAKATRVEAGSTSKTGDARQLVRVVA